MLPPLDCGYFVFGYSANAISLCDKIILMRVLPLPFSTLTEKQKLLYWKKVSVGGPNECWEWTARLKGKGYGHVSINKKHLASTRVAWFLTHGSDPHPFHVLHKCDNKKCCNPAHLFLGTNRQNIEDKIRKGRNGRKLDADRAFLIRRIAHQRIASLTELAGIFGTSISVIWRIKNGTIWKDA